MKTFLVVCLFLISVLQITVIAQNQAFDFVLMPHSVSSFGMGWQGVAFPSNDDAFVYNPAKLSFTNNTRVSFFRNPRQMLGIGPLPLTSISVYHNAVKIGSFGISYENLDWGEFNSADVDGTIGEKYHIYERAFSAGYARNISNNLSIGGELRYAYLHGLAYPVNGFFLSLGMLYNPEFYEKRFTFGFSLMNIGPAVKIEINTEEDINLPQAPLVKHTFYDSPPGQLNIGINFIAAENDFLTLPLNISISKPFDKRNDNGDGESSFKSLFNDWSDFPNDAALNTGIAFQWKQLKLGNDFSFIQEFFLGNYSQGIKSGQINYYTHGVNIGVSYKEFKFTMGYAGVAHNVHSQSFLRWQFPYETFQLALELNDDILFMKNIPEINSSPLKNIFVSAGFGETIRIGKAKSQQFESVNYSTENTLNYSIEAAFYFDADNALVSSFYYNSVPFKYSYRSIELLDSKYESLSFFSSYRNHPFGAFHELYFQAGAGIYRFNYVLTETSPRYDYKTAFQLSTGLLLDFLKPLIIIPNIDYTLLLMPATGSAPRISGYNQFNFLLKIGYVVL